MLSQDIPLDDILPSNKELDRVPHPSHRHAAPSAPWPWVDLDDGWFCCPEKYTCVLAIIIVLIRFTEVDPKQLDTAEPPVPEQCDHSPEKCNRCWMGYPQSLFPNWTERQVRKAKIYNAVHSYPMDKPCICYRVDVNDRGFFSHPEEITAEHGDEDKIWDIIIHEGVSPSRLLDTWSLP